MSSILKGQAEPVQDDSLTRELLDTNKCYILDCGLEVFVWMGRNTSLDERKNASSAAEVSPSFSCQIYLLNFGVNLYRAFFIAGLTKQELLRRLDRPKSHIIRVIEGFETVMFRSKFDTWPETTAVTVSEDGRGKVAGQ